MLFSVFLNFQNHLEQLGKILNVQLASLSCRQKQRQHSGSADESLQVYLLLLTESFVNPPGILAFLFFKFVLKHKYGNFYCP